MQEAAHSTLLRGSRRQLHAHIAETLEAHFPELLDSQPERFAQHYTEAGLAEKSVAFWGKAGQRSAARSAMAEAAAQLQKGLDQLSQLPDATGRQQQKLEFWTALCPVLNAAKGSAAPETVQAYAQARELWERLGSPSEFIQIPYGQSRSHLNRGEFEQALRLDEDLLRLSRRRNDTGGLVLGHAATGANLMLTGRFTISRSHLERVLELYDPLIHHSLVHQAEMHPQNYSQSLLGIALFCLGFPEKALARSSAAIAEARRLNYLPSLALSLSYGARLLSLDGDNAILGECMRELVTVATEQRFPLWRAHGAILRGWLNVKNGDVAGGISLLRSGLSAYRATRATAGTTQYIALLARACEVAGEVEEAVSLFDDGLQVVERTGERWFAAELNRHKGQLLLRQGNADTAEELYRTALSIAEEQEAKLWELARLRQPRRTPPRSGAPHRSP